MTRVRWLLVPLFLLTACRLDVHVADPAVRPDPATLKLGLLTTLTGSAATLGRHVEYAARLALAEINAAGGVNGQRLELLVRDDQLSASIGPLGASELVAAGSVAIVGSFSSRVALPVAEQVTIPANIALLTSGSATSISDLADNDTVWRTVPSDALAGRALADRMLSQGHTRIALIHVNDIFGNGFAAAARSHLEAQGATILSEVSYPTGKTFGFEPEVDQLLANGTPEAIVLVGFALDAASIVQALKQHLGSAMPALFGGGNFGQAFLLNAGDAALGFQGISPTAPTASPNYQYFRSRFLATVGEVPESTAHTGYDGVYLIALALAQAGSNSRAAVVAHLRAVSAPDTATPTVINPGEFARALQAIANGEDIDYQGVGTVFDFTAQGDPASGTYQFWEVVRAGDGSLQIVERAVLTYP